MTLTRSHIRKLHIQARKNKQPEATLLGTLLGNIDTQAKNSNAGNEEQNIVAIIKSLIKSLSITLEHTQDKRPELAQQIQNEIKTLKDLLPQQMDEDALKAFFAQHKAQGITTLGEIMKALKTQHNGQYDGKTAAMVAKTML